MVGRVLIANTVAYRYSVLVMVKNIPLLVILGPTASGKSALAVDLALKLRGELISADSRQVYVGMDVGTAKLRPPREVKQWLTDVVEPDQHFTLKDYQRLANRTIKDIAKRGQLPILVGGTGLYIDAVVDGWVLPKAAPKRLRARLVKQLKLKGLSSLVKELQCLDSSTTAVIDLKNPRRVMRALEYVVSSGESFIKAKQRSITNYDVLKIGLHPGKEKLEKIIKQRAKQMFRHGLVAETKKLQKKYAADLPSMSALEYRVTISYINKEITKNEAIEKIVKEDLKYVKRQLTWFKRDERIVWCRTAAQAKRVATYWLESSNPQQSSSRT